jgi:hypothetical protein
MLKYGAIILAALVLASCKPAINCASDEVIDLVKQVSTRSFASPIKIEPGTIREQSVDPNGSKTCAANAKVDVFGQIELAVPVKYKVELTTEGHLFVSIIP